MELQRDKERVMERAALAADPERYRRAIDTFDTLNDDDPNRASFDGREMGYELFFAIQLYARTLALRPEASEALTLAARCQHLCRWMIPRNDYPRDRAGYLRWRADLKKFHATRAAEVLTDVGYDAELVERVRSLNLKQSLRTDPECQTLEDALCVVFLEKQFAEFSARTDEEKMVTILRKTWGKMSEDGRSAALSLQMDEAQKRLVEKALA